MEAFRSGERVVRVVEGKVAGEGMAQQATVSAVAASAESALGAVASRAAASSMINASSIGREHSQCYYSGSYRIWSVDVDDCPMTGRPLSLISTRKKTCAGAQHPAEKKLTSVACESSPLETDILNRLMENFMDSCRDPFEKLQLPNH